MRKYDFEFQIDSQPVLMPDADVEISMADMESDESGRDECGVLHRILLREKVKSWTLSYATLTEEEYLYLMSLISGKSSFTVQVREPGGTVQQYSAYCSNVGITMHNKRKGLYKNLKLSISEC